MKCYVAVIITYKHTFVPVCWKEILWMGLTFSKFRAKWFIITQGHMLHLNLAKYLWYYRITTTNKSQTSIKCMIYHKLLLPLFVYLIPVTLHSVNIAKWPCDVSQQPQHASLQACKHCTVRMEAFKVKECLSVLPRNPSLNMGSPLRFLLYFTTNMTAS
jgi:hypothetical protein